MKALVYARYSTHKQDGGISIENQISRCKEYATFKDFQIIDVIQDLAMSGGVNRARQGFMELLTRVEQGECDIVLVYDLTRLSREMLSLLAVERFLSEYEVELHTVSDGTVETSSPESFMAFAVKALFSEAERRSAKARTKRAILHLKENGKAFTKERYGWTRIGDEFHEVPEEQKIILLVNQQYKAGNTLADIQRLLRKESIKTRNGTHWQPEQVKRLICCYEQTHKRGGNELGKTLRRFIQAIS